MAGMYAHAESERIRCLDGPVGSRRLGLVVRLARQV